MTGKNKSAGAATEAAGQAMKRNARAPALDNGGGLAAPTRPPRAEELPEKSETLRRRILEATLECYVAYGWGGTNMSVISRHLGMTRGMIQYYFPTLDDVLRASVAHLNNEWRKRYFSYVEQERGSGDRLEVGVKALWRLMQDPLHVAKQELAAAARSSAELRAVMQNEAGFDEATTLDLAKQAYPDLAHLDEAVFRGALDFTVVFLEGLSRHPFSGNAEARCQEQLRMLKTYLAGYWQAQGIELVVAEPGAAAPTPSAAAPAVALADDRSDDRSRERALSLILKAAAILSERPGDGSV